jgi:aminopeptidase
VIPSVRRRSLELAELQGSLISLSGPAASGLLDDIDPARIGRDTVAIKESIQVIADRAVNRTIVPGPTAPWAGLVHPDLEPDKALTRLWSEIAHICRLDESDPAEAWRTRSDQLGAAARRLSEADLDALHFVGPETDLTVGLLPGVRWTGGSFETRWGRWHIPNVPTEEVFTTPDPERTEGLVTSTKPLLVSGRVGERAADPLRGRPRGPDRRGRRCRTNPRARPQRRRRQSLGRGRPRRRQRAGRTSRAFHDTLLDENAASHIGLGSGFPHLARDGATADAERVNSSAVHTDFMIGGPDLEVTGATRDGREVPVLIRGEWAL